MWNHSQKTLEQVLEAILEVVVWNDYLNPLDGTAVIFIINMPGLM